MRFLVILGVVAFTLSHLADASDKIIDATIDRTSSHVGNDVYIGPCVVSPGIRVDCMDKKLNDAVEIVSTFNQTVESSILNEEKKTEFQAKLDNIAERVKSLSYFEKRETELRALQKEQIEVGGANFIDAAHRKTPEDDHRVNSQINLLTKMKSDFENVIANFKEAEMAEMAERKEEAEELEFARRRKNQLKNIPIDESLTQKNIPTCSNFDQKNSAESAAKDSEIVDHHSEISRSIDEAARTQTKVQQDTGIKSV